jgi:hypothetical protein
VGDCDGDRRVTINELISGVAIALGAGADGCPALDADGDDRVSIGELIAAVDASLNGCDTTPTPSGVASPSGSPTEIAGASPTPTGELPVTVAPSATATATATATASSAVSWTPSRTPSRTATATPRGTATATATPTINLPPLLPTRAIYRTYPGFEIRLPLGATDPEGGDVRCTSAALPPGAVLGAASGVLSWMPTADQLGPFYVPLTCADDATPPARVDGQLTFKVSALDACVTPTCDPATGCTARLAPLNTRCCAAGPAARVAEPISSCPEGRVLFVGQNENRDSFGRMQNCDRLRMLAFQQADAEVYFNIQTRCMNSSDPVRLRVRLETTSLDHPLPVSEEDEPFRLQPGDGGFARNIRTRRFGVSGRGPFFDLEGAEANLSVTLIDGDGASVTERIRVRLSFAPHADLPDVDPTPAPAADPR